MTVKKPMNFLTKCLAELVTPMSLTNNSHIPRAECLRRLNSIKHRLGKEPDAQLAKEIDIHHPTVWAFRSQLRIPAFQPERALTTVPKARHQEVLALLKEGKFLQDIVVKTGIRYPAIRAFAQSVGWQRTWTLQFSRENPKVGKLTRVEIYALYDRNVHQSDIAARAGVSRERIRQVVVKSGRKPFRQIQAGIRLERLKAMYRHSADRHRDAGDRADVHHAHLGRFCQSCG